MSEAKEAAAAPKRVESDVYDRQIRLWGADAQVRSFYLSFSGANERDTFGSTYIHVM
jgi:hypothetical protein